ncbi:MAG: ComEC/Rec2 family competence protein [Bacteroidia bacterium]
MFSFRAIPFVRLVLPFILGILLWRQSGINFHSFPLLAANAALVLFFFLLKSRYDAVLLRRLFLLSADLFLLLSALFCCYHYDVRNSEAYYGRHLAASVQGFECTVTDLPQEKERFCKVKAEVNSVAASGSTQAVKGQVLLYIRKPVEAALLQPGSRLRVEGRFNTIAGPLNPHEFDYRQFLADKNIYYQCFIDPAQMKPIGDDQAFSIQRLGLRLKQSIIGRLKNSSLSTEAANLCAALLTGYDEEISPETINAFAHSGTLHVLSVSGLHTGILYAVLVFIFGLVDPYKRFPLLKVACIITLLFSFALIAGFSPPVMRAVIMLSLLVIGRTWFNFEAENSLNILAVSAFGMLFADPLLLFDTGFLLSYLAIIGIMLYAGPIEELWETEHFVLKKIWQLTSVSLAAQITTLPVTLAVFHQFPLWFVFSNLLIIPLCTVVMFLGFLALFKLTAVGTIINICVKGILFLVGLTDRSGWGYIDTIDFNLKDAVLMSLLIILLSAFFRSRSYVSLATALLLLIGWQLNAITEAYAEKNQNLAGVYQISRSYALDIKNRTGLLHSSGTAPGDYNFHVRPNHCTFSYPETTHLNIDYIKTKDVSVFHLKRKEHMSLLRFLQPDYVIVSRDTEIDPDLLKSLRKLKLLVADGSNTYKQVKHLTQLCTNFGISFYSTRDKGFIDLAADKTF